MPRAALQSAGLPGIRFEAVPPRRVDVLPRMDIAAFIGFASRGPLHVPVLVEDMAQFEAIFGSDLALAWDTERGEEVYAFLAPAVRAFFRNGGRRCWIIRVAGEEAHTAWFPVPGLMRFNGSALTPAFTPARSEGSWADALRVGTALVSQPVTGLTVDLAHQTLDLDLNVPGQVVKGDLLRLTYWEQGYRLLFPVSKLESLETDPDSPVTDSARRVRVYAENLFWIRPARVQRPPGAAGTLIAFDHKNIAGSVDVSVPSERGAAPGTLAWPSDDETPVRLTVSGTFDAGLRTICTPGAQVRVDFPTGDPLWLLIHSTSADSGSSGSGQVLLEGQGMWQAVHVPDPTAIGHLDFLERLNFELWVEAPGQARQHLNDLGFAAAQPSFWAALPTDEQLYLVQAGAATGDSSLGSLPVGKPHTGLWLSAQTPRFPLAGPGESTDVFLPFCMAAVPALYAGPDEPPDDALVRDGLDDFNAGLFLDPALADIGTQALTEQADYVRYTSSDPRRLRGVHAAMSVDEVTLIAVPDAAQRGWSRPDPLLQPAPQPVLPLARPEWWHCLPCNPPVQIPREPQPRWGEFLPFDLRLVPAPSLSAATPDSGGSFALEWTSPVAVDRFILEESVLADFSGSREIYRGQATRFVLFGCDQGDTYYHVRSEVDRPDGSPDSSDWSYGIGVRIAPRTGWQLTAPEDYNPDTLCAVQRDLLRLCGVRGDMFAVLSIPEHFREQESIDYALNLRSPLSGQISIDVPALQLAGTMKKVTVAAIGYGEAHNLGFGALYHPWLYSTDNATGTARLNPPDGFITGILAQRAYTRGAWIAPANQVIRSVIALAPLISSRRWLDIQESRINLIRQEPPGYLILSERTLCDDPDWDLISVRRLISLLRRLAQRYGPTWVFEPNDEAFARLVKRTFVSLLDQMFARGAFAGATPGTSYQVNVVTTPRDIDEGRFIVELRVAPSLPMHFITVRLVQSGERSLVTEGG
jgi:hypothetical protein